MIFTRLVSPCSVFSECLRAATWGEGGVEASSFVADVAKLWSARSNVELRQSCLLSGQLWSATN